MTSGDGAEFLACGMVESDRQCLYIPESSVVPEVNACWNLMQHYPTVAHVMCKCHMVLASFCSYK